MRFSSKDIRRITATFFLLNFSLAVDDDQCENLYEPSYFQSLFSRLNSVTSYVSSAYNAVYDLGFGESCPYSDDPPVAVKESLSKLIKGQDIAIEEIVAAFTSWQFKRKAGHFEPLILALTGQTGVGKTESAWTIANALLTRRDGFFPNGLVMFSGVDFQEISKVSEYHDTIRRRIADVIIPCNGNAVIIFDELQKVAARTLDVLLPAFQERSFMALNYKGSERIFNCQNIVVLLVTDIGAEHLRNGILPYSSRENVPRSIVMMAVRKALDKQWKNLHFGKVVNNVIPYLPMRREEIFEVLKLKINDFSDQIVKNGIAMGMHVTAGLLWKLSGDEYIPYGVFHFTFKKNEGKFNEEEVIITHKFAIYGGRVDRSHSPFDFLRKLIIQADHLLVDPKVKLHAMVRTTNGELFADLYSCSLNYESSMPVLDYDSYESIEGCTLLISSPLKSYSKADSSTSEEMHA